MTTQAALDALAAANPAYSYAVHIEDRATSQARYGLPPIMTHSVTIFCHGILKGKPAMTTGRTIEEAVENMLAALEQKAALLIA